MLKKRANILILVLITGLFLSPLTVSAQSKRELERELAELTEKLEKIKDDLQQELKRLQGPSFSVPKLSCVNLDRNLRWGDVDTENNDDVEKLQNFLKNQGDYVYPRATAFFGNITKEAVTRFQRRLGIVPGLGYGIVGRETRDKIEDLSCDGPDDREDNSNISPAYLRSGIVNRPYFQTASVKNESGSGVWVWQITSGAIPVGLNLSQGNSNVAIISGTPRRAGVYNFDLSATNYELGRINRRYQLIINDTDGTLFGP